MISEFYDQSEFFSVEEFDSPDDPGSGLQMHISFLHRLDLARRVAKVPFVINSGFRTKKHNRSVGGVLGSAHTKGYAADIKCNNNADRIAIIQSLLDAGFNRIGIAKTFIHVDNDPSKVKNRIWLY